MINHRLAAYLKHIKGIKALYSSARWQSLRSSQLIREPLCKFCTDKGIVELATVVDHIRPHRGDRALFFMASNLQSLCKLCHDSVKKAIENRDDRATYGEDGWPVNNHEQAGGGVQHEPGPYE